MTKKKVDPKKVLEERLETKEKRFAKLTKATGTAPADLRFARKRVKRAQRALRRHIASLPTPKAEKTA